MKIAWLEKVKGLLMDSLKLEVGHRFSIKTIVLKISPSNLIQNSSIIQTFFQIPASKEKYLQKKKINFFPLSHILFMIRLRD